jgi:hypothetical protein
VDLEISYTYSEHASPMQIWDMFDVGFDLWGLLKVWEGADGVTPALHLASSINKYFGRGNYLQSIPPQFASWLRACHRSGHVSSAPSSKRVTRLSLPWCGRPESTCAICTSHCERH